MGKTQSLMLESFNSGPLEQALLGTILAAPEIIGKVAKIVQPRDFLELKHSWIYESMLALDSQGLGVDYLLVIEALRRRNQLDLVGGPAYLSELINICPDFMQYESYARVIEMTARRRRAFTLSTELAQTAKDMPSDALLPKIREIEKLLQPPAATKENPLKEYLIHVGDLEKLPPIEWLISGEIPTRGLIVLYGPSGVGKSFYALNYAIQLAESVSVLYIAAEGESGYQQRVRAWAKHFNADVKRRRLHFLMSAVALLDKGDFDHLVEIVEDMSPRLIVIDTLAHSMLPGDENNTRDMAMFVKAAKMIQRQLGCAVLLVHHTNKLGENERGSGALRAAADMMVRLIDMDDVIAVECSKSKDSQKFAPRYVKLLPVEIEDGQYVPVMVPAKLIVRTKDDPLTASQQRVVDALAEPLLDAGATVLELEPFINMGRGNLYKVLNTLVKLGYVEKSGASFTLNDIGRGKANKSDMTPMTPDVTRDVTPANRHGKPMTPMTPANVSFSGTPGEKSKSHESHGVIGSASGKTDETSQESRESSESWFEQRNLWGNEPDRDAYYRDGH